jgi:hypothetical protein
MLNVPVVLLVAAVAVLAGVVYVATGRGGELAFFQADYAPLKMDQVTSTDVALFRPPTALWGYSMQATDEALSRIAHAITERDIEISALQQQVADLEAATARRRAYAAPEKSPAERPDLPVRGERPERDEPRGRDSGRDIWQPATRTGPAPDSGSSSTEWAALPKRREPSAGDDEEDGR